MCGIAGVVALGERPTDAAWAEPLLAALRHRGPDGSGVFRDPRALLVHTRLAIIDTGEGGAQPMHSGDQRHVIVQNGEIYNYQELTPELARRRALHTCSDTEVLLESLVLDGPAALERLRGMWAFGLWDRERGELLLARDRLGKKPIVWFRTPEFFAFASEAQALLALPFVRARLDRRALPLYLRHLYVPAPYTLIEGMRKLPAACWMRVRSGGAPEDPVRYWRLPEPDPARRPDAEWFRALDHEIVEAARLRTVSDVPIGVFLSGGVDSNLVLEALHRSGHRPIRTYTLGFAGLPDERRLAALGAKRFSDDHVELVVTPHLEDDVQGVLRGFADPLGDSAVVTNALIAREAAKHVKVAVNGDGGDELFGGYPRYPFARRADVAGTLPGGLAALRWRYQGRANAEPALEMLDAHRPRDAAEALCGFLTPAGLDSLLTLGSPAAHDLAPPPVPGAEGPSLVRALFAWDTGYYLPDDLLVKVDVASMQFALENRSPLLDHRVFEHVARLPPERRVDLFDTKPLLKRHARGRIDSGVLEAPKRGFQLPLQSWLRGALRPWLTRMLAPGGATSPLFRAGALEAERSAFDSGGGDALAAYRVWALAALEFWARTFAVDLAA